MEQQILDKIKKLFALANDKNNLNEAAAAAAKAQELLTKYNLAAASVVEDVEKPKQKEYLGQPVYSSPKKKTVWKQQLLGAIVSVNGCYYFNNRSEGFYQLMVVGTKENIEIVKYFFDSIVYQIEALCKSYMDELNMGRAGAKRMANSFKLGAVQTISERLSAADREAKKEYEGTRALILVERESEEVKAWAISKFKLVFGKTNVVSPNAAAFSRGREAGHRVTIAKAISSSKKTNLLD